MNNYKTLNCEVFNINGLKGPGRKVYSEVKSYFKLNPEWTDFSNFWMKKIKNAFSDLKASQIVKKDIYAICQDMDSRLGIKQGHTREPDYRDLLADIIDNRYKSRYQLCKKLELDQGFLSSVLNKKKHISMEKLESILSAANHRITFTEKVK